ncbi:hypothetical protein ACIQPR_10830 [Streptomyces sp. NPDC091280]|uniref:hypothetical protein n=1 Tax=Streptomyces sp. NPDC091280 TaxID=3365984 RepID=UPI0038137046
MSTAIEAAPEDSSRPTWNCFVIGPIGDKHAEHGSPERLLYDEALYVYDEVIRAACQAHGLVPLRADAIADTGEITDQIHRRLHEDDIVIADVSGGNPNVMYELGFRIGRGKPVILIGESGDLPFDIAQLRTIRFRRTDSSLYGAREQLSRVLYEGVTHGFRTVTYADVTTSGPAPANDEDGVDDEVPGIVDRLAQAEEQMESVLADVEAMGEAVVRIGEVAKESTLEMNSANEASLPASARLALVRKFSTAVAEPAAAFRASAETFAERMADIEAGMHASLDIIEDRPSAERDEDMVSFLHQVIEIVESTRSGTANFTEFGSSMRTVAGYSQLLRAPGRDIEMAVRAITSVATRIDPLGRRARALLTTANSSTSAPDHDTAVPTVLSHVRAS